jgi:hypothetical protein
MCAVITAGTQALLPSEGYEIERYKRGILTYDYRASTRKDRLPVTSPAVQPFSETVAYRSPVINYSSGGCNGLSPFSHILILLIVCIK